MCSRLLEHVLSNCKVWIEFTFLLEESVGGPSGFGAVVPNEVMYWDSSTAST